MKYTKSILAGTLALSALAAAGTAQAANVLPGRANAIEAPSASEWARPMASDSVLTTAGPSAAFADALAAKKAAQDVMPLNDVLVDDRFPQGFIPGTRVPVSPVPEASTWAMLIMGLGFAGAGLRRAGQSTGRRNAGPASA